VLAYITAGYMIKEIEQILQKYWGYSSFLPLQKKAMQCVIGNQDSIVVLPTGGGKSLCFQAPALTFPGLAVVVSPLISLMKDQVDALTECGVPAARIDSSQSPQEQKDAYDLINNKKLKLLYVSPERLLSNGFIDYLKNGSVSFVAIDEAHCVSMWGHDFRPEYRELGLLKKTFPDIKVHAYTATATEQVRRDIAVQLNLATPEILVGSFDRPNLVFKVDRTGDIVNQVCKVLDRHKGESGIIYCIRRLDVDEMHATLSSMGYKTAPYHAGMDVGDRKKNQDAFIKEKIDTIVATIAFGMGIDKSNVRYVIHTGMPKSLEHYQQESGRAGRDGLEAECCLFYSGGDFNIWKYLLKDMKDNAKNIALKKLNDMYNYCTGVTCRHKAIVSYFGQKLNKSNCGGCDICLGGFNQIKDSLVVSQKILSCIVRLGERFGADYTTLVLIGSSEKRILDNGHNKLSTYSLLSDYSKRAVRGWIEQLVSQEFINKTSEFNILNLTGNGRLVLKGEKTPKLFEPVETQIPMKTPKAAEESWEGVDSGLFEALRILRREIADKKRVPAFIVFSDAVLRDMARRRPSTLTGFHGVSGVGEQKLRQYGKIFTAEIIDYCKANSITMDVEPAPVMYSSKKRSKSSRAKPNRAKQTAFKMFAQGHSIEKVAKSIERAESTTTQYLVEFIQKENVSDPFPWADIKTYKRVVKAAYEVDAPGLKPIYEHLDGEVDYSQIRICIACLENSE